MDLQKLLKSMTLEEKLCQMTQFNANVLDDSIKGDITGPIAKLNITNKQINSIGSILNVWDVESTINLQKNYLKNNRHKIPLLVMIDVIHGYRTIYPIPLGLGATFDEEIVKECSAMAAKEAAVNGVHVTFSPMVDMVRDARWGRVMETTGEDGYLNSRLVKAFVEGYQGDLSNKYNVAACVKHFAAYGGAEAGRDYNLVDMSEHVLRNYYLPGYKAAIDAGVEMIMTSFNTLNGIPAAGNKWLVKDILRDEWKCDKVVISDYNAFIEMIKHGFAKDEKTAALYAIKATNDIEMVSTTYLKNMETLINDGKVSMKEIDEAVMRILKLKEKLNLFENPFRAASVDEAKKLMLCKEHRDLVRIAAEKSAVLLKNEEVLPFSKTTKSAAVIGPFADKGMIGFWHCAGKEEEAVTVLQGIKNILPEAKVDFTIGCDSKVDAKVEDNVEEINKAVEIAKNNETVILCLGEEADFSGEGNSRADICLSPAQKELIKEIAKVNKNFVVVLFTGRPLVLTDIIDDVPALFVIWQPGTEGGNAVANLVFGKSTFTGKLPMTFPRSVGQCPIYYNSYNTGRPAPLNDTTCGYSSRYIDCYTSPLFPFGYGLTYTKFEISKPELDKKVFKKGEKIIASCKVKNVGNNVGTETIQLYIRDLFASVVRPIKELKGYQKLTLNPNEEKIISFEIDEEMLKFWNFQNEYVVEEGEFELFISNSSIDAERIKFEYLG